MKKIYMILCAAMMVAGTMKAEVLLNEHFAQKTDLLADNANVMANPIETSGWTNVSLSGAGIYVDQNTDLTYSGYKSATDNTGSASYKTVAKAAATPLSRTINIENGNVKSVFVAGILKVSSIGASTQSTRDYIWALGKGTSSLNNTSVERFLRLSMRLGDNGNSFQLAVSKLNEATNFQPWTGDLAYNKNYLIVTEYRYVEGEKNDSVFLYINPGKDDYNKYSLTSKQDTLQSGVTQKGSISQVDAPTFGSMMLISVSSVKPTLFIDELRVATKWSDLWEEGGSGGEGGDPEPIIVSEGKISLGDEYGFTYSHKQYTKTVEVLAENLTENIAVTHVNPAVALSATSLDKDGGELTITLDKPQNAGYGYDTLTFSSSGVKEKLYVEWYNTLSYSTLAALKAAYANDDDYGMYYYSGEAVVTRKYTGDFYGEYSIYYIQDATAAIRLTNMYNQADELAIGDKISEFPGYADEQGSDGVRPLILAMDPTVLSSGNSVEPQVVTLAALQAAPADYLLELVKIENATLDQKGEVFKAGSNVAISQGGVNATLQPINSSADYIGLTIPEKADITGFSTNIAGTIIVPRDKNDIVEKGGETGVIQVQRDNVPCTKVLRGGQLYILRGGVQYNILGINQK